MGAPLAAGAVHETVIEVEVTDVPSAVGAPGTVAGVPVAPAEAGDVPIALVAVTVKV